MLGTNIDILVNPWALDFLSFVLSKRGRVAEKKLRQYVDFGERVCSTVGVKIDRAQVSM